MNKSKEEIVEEFIKWQSSETTFAYGVPGDRSIAEWWLDKFTTHSQNREAEIRKEERRKIKEEQDHELQKFRDGFAHNSFNCTHCTPPSTEKELQANTH